MKKCSICGERVATSVCRRCGRPVCAQCYFHHGLCKACARALGRLRRGKPIIEVEGYDELRGETYANIILRN